MILRLLPVAALLALAACGSGSSPPGAATPGEARQLDDAAVMLDANSVDANAAMIVNEE